MLSPRARRILPGVLLALTITATGTATADGHTTPARTAGDASTGKTLGSPAHPKVGRIDQGPHSPAAVPTRTLPLKPGSGERCEPTLAGSRERRAGAVKACVTTRTKPVAQPKRQARAVAQPQAAAAATNEGSCAIAAPGTWNYSRFGYCVNGLEVLYTLKDTNGKVVGTGTLTVASSALLPAARTAWNENVTVAMTGATGAVTTLTAKFRAECSAGCKVTKAAPWYGGQLTTGQSVSGNVSYSSSPAPGTKVDFTTSYKLYVTAPGAQATDPNASWDNPEKVRCDDDVRDTSAPNSTPAAGCVVPSVVPVLSMSTSTSGAAAAGYLWAQQNLTDGWGRAKPLTRARSGITDRTDRTCGGSQPFADRSDLVPNDSCGEFPFASTHEGGTDGAQCAEVIPNASNGGWDIYDLGGADSSKRCVRAHVPQADNQAALAQLAEGYANQRVLERDQFKLDIASTTSQPRGACLQTRPSNTLPNGDGWIKNTTETVAHRNKNTTPTPDVAGTRPTAAEACLGKKIGNGTSASGDITGWQDAQIYAKPLAAPGTKAPYGLARCHLIANILGGKGRTRDGGQDNLVPCWQVGMNTGTPSMRTYEYEAQTLLGDNNFGANDAIFYQVTPTYLDATSTVPVGVTMKATVQRADGTTQPLFPDVYIPNTKADTGQHNLGN
ncbi:DNA/RNA non-specific endonuclease [Streptomyces noboritoensis]|uniref:DNA/RNA non-specific endonuclease n=1 Tax=Streptomyces noboritoensis TaxID=67337 RepID=A0ABV6T8X1_9ACTN